MNTIVKTVIDSGGFKTLVTALKTADLVETLNGNGPFTVFAPTDDAFAKLPEETVKELINDKEALIKILTYHVISGKVMAKDVMNISSAKTLQGGDLAIETTGGVMINNAKVIKADLECSNGVIHIIDTVLMPE